MSEPSNASLDWCLQANGEMAARMRGLDWSSTPLGPVGLWPAHLKVAVSVCLRSRFPIAIFWGREHFTMLYNDAYIPFLGARKHPDWLGRSARECWREVWDTVGPMLDSVFATGEATWREDLMLTVERHLPREECHFTFSYGAIPSRSSLADGIFCVCTETTDRVVGERRLRTLRELGVHASAAQSEEEACEEAAKTLESGNVDVPFSLIYLLTPDHRSARLTAWSGVGARAAAGYVMVDLSEPSQTEALPADVWPLQQVLATAEPALVTDVGARFGPLSGGPWREPPELALVLPLARPGQIVGFLVAGISPRRVLDESYRAFLNLIAGQVATSIMNARAFEEERRRTRALAEIDSAKTAFFSNVSHEFRTPLTLMLGPLDDALADAQSPLMPPQRERIDAAYRNSLRLLKLVNTLLDFSRIEAGRVRAAFEPVDLAALTAELASNFRSACERAGLRLKVACPSLPHPVYVDRDMWEKIVLNLLSNAFKFTFEGEIEVTQHALEGGVELHVRDTGTGIAAEEIPHLFTRFHRIRGVRARTTEGTGIGLALVQELVHLHGGSIRADSTPGVGTRFIVGIPFGSSHLPAEQIGGKRLLAPASVGARPFVEEALRWISPEYSADEAVTATIPMASRPAGGEAEARSRPLVLCVDDNSDMRLYMSRLLASSYDVIAASDGEQALDIALAYEPDLIVTDAMMPQMDGVTLLKTLRTCARTARIPVIILSARAGEDARVQGYDAGADDYLAKPFSARELLARARSQLALSTARRERERERIARVGAEVQREDFHSLFMQAPNMFMILRGTESRVELANPAACQVLRRRHEEIINRPLFEAVPELRASGLEERLEEVLRTGAPCQGREIAWRIRWRGSDAPETEYFTFVHSPLRNPEGQIEGVLINSFNVTDEVVARQQMNRLRSDAEEANRMKDEFLAMLGHELRNPLAPILTALQVMKLRGGDSREHAILERQVAHLRRLVDDLLDVSRITRGKIELRRRPMEIVEAVTSALEMANPLLEQRRHRVEMDVPREGLKVEGDSERLAQVLLNLLTNAAKYSDVGSCIRILARHQDGHVRVSVRDEGVGIEPGMLDKVFELFVQQPQTLDRSRGGLGLGLSIVRNLVEMHQGRVSVRSAGPGKGSEFIVELPELESEGDPAAGKAPLARHPLAAQHPTASSREQGLSH